jgi:DNA-binding MarR family transcriptional regulator
MTVSSVVRTLADRGLVDRQEDGRDRRAKILQITAVGASLVDKAVPMIEAFDRRFFLDRLGTRKEVFMKDLDRLAQE